jgi:alpha-1,3-rhamnosyltransferase
VKAAIQSVINQDYDNIELIIIDDGSKDDSVLKIAEMRLACQARFTRFELRQRPNKGLSATLNEALEWCEGEFFAPIASDDILMSHKTSKQVDYLKRNPQSGGVFGSLNLIDSENVAKKNLLLSFKFKKIRKFYFNDIFLHCHNLPAPSQMLRLISVKKAGGYRIDLILEDWAMWLDLTKDGSSLDYVDGIVVSYRRHDGNMSSKIKVVMEGRIEVLTAFNNHRLFQSALAKAYLQSAHDWQFIDKYESRLALKKSLTSSLLSILSVSFVKYCLKHVLYHTNFISAT